MVTGENGASGASAPSPVRLECRAESESAIIRLQLTVVKTAKDQLNKHASVTKTYPVLVSRYY